MIQLPNTPIPILENKRQIKHPEINGRNDNASDNFQNGLEVRSGCNGHVPLGDHPPDNGPRVRVPDHGRNDNQPEYGVYVLRDFNGLASFEGA